MTNRRKKALCLKLDILNPFVPLRKVYYICITMTKYFKTEQAIPYVYQYFKLIKLNIYIFQTLAGE